MDDSSARRRSAPNSRKNQQRVAGCAGGCGCCCSGGADRARALCLSGCSSRLASCVRCYPCTMVRPARMAPRPTPPTTGEGGQAPRPSIVGEWESQTWSLPHSLHPRPPPRPAGTPPLGSSQKSGGDYHFPP